jgi:hypothetical protein
MLAQQIAVDLPWPRSPCALTGLSEEGRAYNRRLVAEIAELLANPQASSLPLETLENIYTRAMALSRDPHTAADLGVSLFEGGPTEGLANVRQIVCSVGSHAHTPLTTIYVMDRQGNYTFVQETDEVRPTFSWDGTRWFIIVVSKSLSTLQYSQLWEIAPAEPGWTATLIDTYSELQPISITNITPAQLTVLFSGWVQPLCPLSDNAASPWMWQATVTRVYERPYGPFVLTEEIYHSVKLQIDGAPSYKNIVNWRDYCRGD